MSALKRPRIGGRRKGTPNRATADLREAAQAYTHEALAKLVQIMRTGQSEQIQMQAAIALLDRAHGRPCRQESIDEKRSRISRDWRDLHFEVRPPKPPAYLPTFPAALRHPAGSG